MARPKALYELDDPKVVSMRTKNICIYAHPGAGKTVLLGTGDESLCFLDSDEGVDSAQAFGSKAKALPCQDYDDLVTAYEWLKHDAPKEAPELRWVAWDSLTLFQDRALIDDLLVDAHAENPRQSEDVASQREYLMNMNRIGKYVRMFVALPLNFIITAHVMTDTNADGEIIYMPAITGKRSGASFSSYVMGYMNVVGYLGKTDSGKRRLVTEMTGPYFAKDRFHALRTNVRKDGQIISRGYVDEPTLPKIESLFEAKKAETSKGKAAARPARPRRPVRKGAASASK